MTSEERRNAKVDEEFPHMEKIRKKLSGKLPQWPQLEGQADELVAEEACD